MTTISLSCIKRSEVELTLVQGPTPVWWKSEVRAIFASIYQNMALLIRAPRRWLPSLVSPFNLKKVKCRSQLCGSSIRILREIRPKNNESHSNILSSSFSRAKDLISATVVSPWSPTVYQQSYDLWSIHAVCSWQSQFSNLKWIIARSDR